MNDLLEKYRLSAENAVNKEFGVRYQSIPETVRVRKSESIASKKKSQQDSKGLHTTMKDGFGKANSLQKKENSRSIDNVNTNHHQYRCGHRRVKTAANPNQLQGISPLRNRKQQQPMRSPPNDKISVPQDPSPLPSKPPPASTDTNNGSLSDNTTNLYYFNTSMFKIIDSSKQGKSHSKNGFAKEYTSP